jgi:hypothetical protein
MTLFDELALDHVNSATKYPSIATYHVLKGRGNLTESRSCTFGNACLVTEKVDGANARIVFFASSGDYLIGSREELLHAKGDRIANPSMRVVEATRPIADRMVDIRSGLRSDSVEDVVLVVWGEVYGCLLYTSDAADDVIDV